MIAETVRTTRAARNNANNKILKRGMACLNCRQFKIKCDGQKPVCGPCMHHPRRDECDYDDGPGPTKMRQLEEEIARLKQRIFDLENPGASTPPVTLHDPYLPFNQSQKLHITIPSQPSAHPSSPYSPISPASSHNGLPSSSIALPTPLTHTSAYPIGGSRPSPAPTFLGTTEPSYHIQQTLIEKFIPYSVEFGFFLCPDQFFNAALQPASFGDPQRPTPGLLSAVYLWGAHLSHEDLYTRHENIFLTRALQFTATDIVSDHPNKVLHALQAQVLLAYYFLRTGRIVEAKVQTAAAVTLALENGLHQLQASASSPSYVVSPDGSLSPSQEPSHARSDADFINCWWAVFGLHKLISAGTDSSVNYFGNVDSLRLQIDTPWPMDPSQYQAGALPNASKNTVREFLTNGSTTEAEGSSISAMCAKAMVLYHRATQIADQGARFCQ
ncbi:hypothetical protein AX16_005819 [Volvariella volvacea WC 439]|nr:hypothetical protein AX16_005819 [Volvariella volvacea WC 439]